MKDTVRYLSRQVNSTTLATFSNENKTKELHMKLDHAQQSIGHLTDQVNVTMESVGSNSDDIKDNQEAIAVLEGITGMKMLASLFNDEAMTSQSSNLQINVSNSSPDL